MTIKKSAALGIAALIAILVVVYTVFVYIGIGAGYSLPASMGWSAFAMFLLGTSIYIMLN